MVSRLCSSDPISASLAMKMLGAAIERPAHVDGRRSRSADFAPWCGRFKCIPPSYRAQGLSLDVTLHSCFSAIQTKIAMVGYPDLNTATSRLIILALVGFHVHRIVVVH